MTGFLPVQDARRDACYKNDRRPCLTIQLMLHLFGQAPGCMLVVCKKTVKFF